MQSDGLSLEVTRRLRAPRPHVFEWFVDPARLARWWGPEGFSIPSIDFRPSVGSTYRIEMLPPGGSAFHLTGTFHELERPSRLAFSFRWQPPDDDDVETVATLSFRAAGDATEVRLDQGPFKTDARRALHGDGWGAGFDKLEQLLSARE